MLSKIIACFLVIGAVASSSFATELYNLDFTQPEIGSYQTVFGNPTIQPSVGPFTDALLFHAVTGYDQIELPINGTGPQYDIQFDLLTHNLRNSQYLFNVLLDAPDVRTLLFHGGTNTVFTFYSGTQTDLAPLVDDQVFHVEIALNFPANTWSVSLNGVLRFTGAVNATHLDSIRLNMAPWITGATNAPGTYAAIDNVVVTVVPELSSMTLLILGSLCAFRRRR